MKYGRGVFVAGTDTDVGKTMVAASVTAALRARGLDAGYVKPVSSDGREVDGGLVSPDAVRVKRLAGLGDPWPILSPVCVPHPLSPLASSRLEGRELTWGRILRGLEASAGAHRFMVWEGVGGVLVPVAAGKTALDLMAELGLPVLVAARPLLGTINHTLLTIEASRRRGLEVLGFCFSGPAPEQADDPAIADNAQFITEFCGAPYLGSLPWLTESEDGSAAQAAIGHLDMEPLYRLAG